MTAKTSVLIIWGTIAIFAWSIALTPVFAIGAPPDMADELATTKIHERDGRKFLEFRGSDGLYYVYCLDNDEVWPSEPILATEYCATRPECNVRCAYKTEVWAVAPNRSYPDAPVYERQLVDGKRVKLKHPNGGYFRAVIGMDCGNHSYYPSTGDTEYRDVNFVVDGVQIRGMARCEKKP